MQATIAVVATDRRAKDDRVRRAGENAFADDLRQSSLAHVTGEESILHNDMVALQQITIPLLKALRSGPFKGTAFTPPP